MATIADLDLHCGPCQYNSLTKHASKWCTDCEEGFCNECLIIHQAAKLSRNHHVITAEDHQKTKEYKVNLQCTNHCKQLEFYCPSHDGVVCVECVQLNHSSCKNLMPLDEAANGAKTSAAYTDLEDTINGLLENMERGVEHLQQNKIYQEKQGDVTKKAIELKRAEINKHLDHLEQRLLKELKTKSETAMTELSLMTTKFETKHKIISDLKDTVQKMIKFSSNLQVFVGIRSIMNTAVKERDEIKLLVNNIPQLSIAVQFNPKFDTIFGALESLGKIQITPNTPVVSYVERRLIQAQYRRPDEAPVHKLDNLQLKLRTHITMSEKNFRVTSCLILPNMSIMIASGYKLSLTILKQDGSHDRDIRVRYTPYDVTIIDDQRVAVSYGKACISIVNINTQNTDKTMKNLGKHRIYGITYNDGKLYVFASGKGIKVIDLDGNIIKKIRIYNNALSTYKVATQKDQIYLGSVLSVQCVDMEGAKIWECEDYRLETMDGLALAVDSYGMTFAAGEEKNILLAISPDGKQKKVLLTISDELQYPKAIYYDKESKRLLVCNGYDGHAALYDVIY